MAVYETLGHIITDPELTHIRNDNKYCSAKGFLLSKRTANVVLWIVQNVQPKRYLLNFHTLQI